MANPVKYVAVPYCAQCHKIEGTGSWKKLDGSQQKTAEKLSRCSSCHMARYCSMECWKNDLGHRLSCKESEKLISLTEVDKIVKTSIVTRVGKATLCLGAKRPYISDNGEESKELTVCVYLGDEPVGQLSYTWVEFNWKEQYNQIQTPKQLVSLGHEMIKNGFYTEAFQMMAETGIAQKLKYENLFFKKAVTIMHNNAVELETILSCAAILDRNCEEVNVIIAPPKEETIPNKLAQAIEQSIELGPGERTDAMFDHAKALIDLKLYNAAFKVASKGIGSAPLKEMLFDYALEKMRQDGFSHEKIVQLARSIELEPSKVKKQLEICL